MAMRSVMHQMDVDLQLIKAMYNDVKKRTEELDSITSDLEIKFTRLDTNNKNYSKSITNCINNIATIKAYVSRVQTEMVSVKNAIAVLKNKVDNLQSNASRLNISDINLKTQINEIEQETTLLESRSKHCEDTLDSCMKSIESFSTDRSFFSGSLTTIKYIAAGLVTVFSLGIAVYELFYK